ncbi:MAG: hypothetical protein VX031_00720, partial [Bacteroidota bacterium]|nr:hypothetical protein [Bacteroidota bacterium]
MSTTQHMQNKAGIEAGLSVDEVKLNFEGGKQYTNDDVESVDSWEDDASDDEDDRVPGGGTPAQIAADAEEQEFAAQLETIKKEQEKLKKAFDKKQKAVQQNRSRQLNTPIKDDQTDLDFGTYDFVRSLFDFNFGKELSKSNFYKSANVADQKAMADLLEKLRDLWFTFNSKLHDKLDAFHWEGGGEGDVAVRKKTIEDANRLFKNRIGTILQSPAHQSLLFQLDKSTKELIESRNKKSEVKQEVINNNDDSPKVQEVDLEKIERVNAFQQLAKQKQTVDKTQLKCTRVCNEFKTGCLCQVPFCTYAHSIQELRPKRCYFAGSCNKMNRESDPCECSHPIDGTDEWETTEMVVARLKLAKPLPEVSQKQVIVNKPKSRQEPNEVATLRNELKQHRAKVLEQQHTISQLKQSANNSSNNSQHSSPYMVPQVNPWNKGIVNNSSNNSKQSSPSMVPQVNPWIRPQQHQLLQQIQQQQMMQQEQNPYIQSMSTMAAPPMTAPFTAAPMVTPQMAPTPV